MKRDRDSVCVRASGCVESGMARYRKLLDSLRRAFPQPVSDQVHDAYFAFSILRALDQVDARTDDASPKGRVRG